ncbi:MAG TPA: TlpA disulfide reductase family protein [bacterium]|nr:TlpA disulfide reductase family protein [bacterium]
MKSLYATTVLLISAIAMTSCAKAAAPGLSQEAPQQNIGQTGKPVDDGERLVEAAATNKPWYSDRLEALGFYVFPAPEPIPSFSVKTLKGADATLATLSGKVVLLNFWATWCPPCKMEMPSIQVLHEKMKGASFEIMAISVSEKPATVTDFLKNNPYTYPMYLDENGSASAPFASRGIPTTFILDKQGRAIAGIVGSRSYDGPEVLTLFKELAERL